MATSLSLSLLRLLWSLSNPRWHLSHSRKTCDSIKALRQKLSASFRQRPPQGPGYRRGLFQKQRSQDNHSVREQKKSVRPSPVHVSILILRSSSHWSAEFDQFLFGVKEKKSSSKSRPEPASPPRRRTGNKPKRPSTDGAATRTSWNQRSHRPPPEPQHKGANPHRQRTFGLEVREWHFWHKLVKLEVWLC